MPLFRESGEKCRLGKKDLKEKTSRKLRIPQESRPEKERVYKAKLSDSQKNPEQQLVNKSDHWKKYLERKKYFSSERSKICH